MRTDIVYLDLVNSEFIRIEQKKNNGKIRVSFSNDGIKFKVININKLSNE